MLKLTSAFHPLFVNSVFIWQASGGSKSLRMCEWKPHNVIIFHVKNIKRKTEIVCIKHKKTAKIVVQFSKSLLKF